ATINGEAQYRTSSAFDAPIFALSAKGMVERYNTDNRDGHRYNVGFSVLQPVTDRITAFAAVSRELRFARNAVFEGQTNAARANIDYGLHKDGVLYLSGERRHGDTVSTARPALVNLDIAKMFTVDDVFNKGYTSYRFDAVTWIGTLGYNIAFGSQHSL